MNFIEERNMEAIESVCPTDVLVDISDVISCTDKEATSSIAHEKNKAESNNGVISNKNLEVERKVSSGKNCSKEDSSNFLQSPSEENTQILDNRLRWKTPSPKSMSRISKEASKVIQRLNSSDIFNEGELLTEEMLPMPINFDAFDTDDISSEKKVSTPSRFSDKKNYKMSVDAQTKNNVNDKVIGKELMDSSNSNSICLNDASSKNSNESCFQSPSKTNFDVSRNNSGDDECKKREVSMSIGSNCVDDVFLMTHVPAEDKENIHRKGNKVIMLKKTPGMKLSNEIPLTSKKKLNYHGTLLNTSNTKCEASAKYLYSSGDKKENAPSKKNAISMKAKTVQPLPLKSKIKRPVLSDTSDQKLNTTMKNSCLTVNPVCNFSSSAMKQQNVSSKIKTPLRRYSVCAPLKCASSVNPVTPSDFRNHEISRFTPQSARACLSFSRSCQQFSKPSTFSSVKHQNSFSSTSLDNVKESLGRISSLKEKAPSFSQSTSSISYQSLKRNSMYSSSTYKFSSKLCMPSPLPVEQEKKLARALFSSAPKWKN